MAKKKTKAKAPAKNRSRKKKKKKGKSASLSLRLTPEIKAVARRIAGRGRRLANPRSQELFPYSGC